MELSPQEQRDFRSNQKLIYWSLRENLTYKVGFYSVGELQPSIIQPPTIYGSASLLFDIHFLQTNLVNLTIW